MNLGLYILLQFTFLLAIVIWLWVGSLHYFQKLRWLRRYSKIPKEDYTKPLIIGIVSGAMVLVTDKVISKFSNNMPDINTSNWVNFLFSVLDALLAILIVAGVFLFAITFLMYTGYFFLKNQDQRKRN